MRLEVYTDVAHIILDLKYKITGFIGDSGVGKTNIALSVDMFNGKQPSVNLICDLKVRVLNQDGIDSLVDSYLALKEKERSTFILRNTVYIIDEGYAEILSKHFHTIIAQSINCFYVLIGRSTMHAFSVNVHAVNTLRKDSDGISRNYEVFDKVVYGKCNFNTVVTEDKGSGYKVISSVFEQSKLTVISAEGKNNITERITNNSLVLCDGAGFGYNISDIIGTEHGIPIISKEFMLVLLESFEWLLYYADVVHNTERLDKTNIYLHPGYKSYEEYCFRKLVEDTSKSGHPYSKSGARLHKWYTSIENRYKLIMALHKILNGGYVHA